MLSYEASETINQLGLAAVEEFCNECFSRNNSQVMLDQEESQLRRIKSKDHKPLIDRIAHHVTRVRAFKAN